MQPPVTSYTSLEPTNLNSLGVSAPSFDAKSTQSIFTTSSFLYSLFFTAIVMAAFYRYVVAGTLRMQASEQSIRLSNEIIKKVTLGLLGVFSLFLILVTVNKNMVSGTVGLDGLRANGGGGNTTTQNPVSTQTGPGTVANSGSHTYQQRVTDHNRAASALAPIKTNHNNTPCTEAEFNQKGSIPPCTSLAFLPEETIQLLLNINGSCKCSLVVTGGTEPNHQSHGEGLRAVDIRLTGPRGDSNNTDPLYVYIKSIAINKLGSNSKCFERYLWHTFTFCDEKPPNDQHFHVN
jgi:hypothetical protein